MPAYLIVTREGPIADEEAYAAYKQANQERRSPIKLTPRAVNGRIEALEGEAPDGCVVLEFETAEQARGWYESPEYQAAVTHRLRSGTWRAFIVDGL